MAASYRCWGDQPAPGESKCARPLTEISILMPESHVCSCAHRRQGQRDTDCRASKVLADTSASATAEVERVKPCCFFDLAPAGVPAPSTLLSSRSPALPPWSLRLCPSCGVRAASLAFSPVEAQTHKPAHACRAGCHGIMCRRSPATSASKRRGTVNIRQHKMLSRRAYCLWPA